MTGVTMVRTFVRCAVCQCEFAAPKTRAYCSRRCELAGGQQPTAEHVARMDVDRALEVALPWERAVAARVIRKAETDPFAVRQWLRVSRCIDDRILGSLRTLVAVMCKVRSPRR